MMFQTRVRLVLCAFFLGSMLLMPALADGKRELNDDVQLSFDASNLSNVQIFDAHPDMEELQDAFYRAAEDNGVPVELLEAIAFVESRWFHGGPTIDQGYGIMHLVNNDQVRTLKEAARLTGYSVQELKTDPYANIDAAAALIAHYVEKTNSKPESLMDYSEALSLFTGLHEDVRAKQVLEYYRVLAEGAYAKNNLGMEIELLPVDEEINLELLAPSTRVALRSTEYGPAIWDPAHYSNYSTGRSVSIDRWVNHWIGVGTYAGAISWFKNSSANVSAHFVIRKSDGELTQMVSVSNTGWHCGSWNSRSIGIEHEATTSNPWPTSSSSPMLVNSAACCAHFCDQYGMPKTRTYIVAHNEVPGSSTQCPGPLPWTTYMDLVNATGPEFTNALTNGGFEDDMDSWDNGSSTTTQVLTSGAHRGSKACRFYNGSGGYATIWQNPNEVSGEVWRTTCWAYRQSGMTSAGFGFKDQSGVTEAEDTITSSSWEFQTVDWTIADNIDSQAWGYGSTGVMIDDVRCGKASRMNWITDWLWNGPHSSSISTDYFSSDGGETNIEPNPGVIHASKTWTAVNSPDGFIDLDDALGGVSNCVTYAHVYVYANTQKTDVNLLVGSDDGIKVLLNGVVVHTNDVNRGQDYFNPDKDIISGLTLNAGENSLLIKVREASGAYSFSARFCDDDGDAISGLTYSIVNDVDDVMIESRSGGQNYSWYSETGVWANSGVSCTATGVTPNIGTRYGSTYTSIVGIKRAYYEPTIPVTGEWEVFVTYPAAGYRRSPILYRVTHDSGSTDVNVNQTLNSNTWVSLGTYTFSYGTGAAVRISNDNIDVSGSMYAGAVKFVFVEP